MLVTPLVLNRVSNFKQIQDQGEYFFFLEKAIQNAKIYFEQKQKVYTD